MGKKKDIAHFAELNHQDKNLILAKRLFIVSVFNDFFFSPGMG